MFIERSAGRIRLARMLFVLLGLLPCAGLVAWAAVWHSSGHRAAVQRQVERLVGLPVGIGSVEHVRPGVMRLRDCRLSLPVDGGSLTLPLVEVESSANEVRLAIDRLDCTPAAAGAVAALAGQWLRQPARYPINCVVDVAVVGRGRPAADSGGMEGSVPRPPDLRAECVAANGSRAVRMRLAGAGGEEPDEFRVVAVPPEGEGGRAGRLEVNGSIADPVPVAVIAAVAGLEPESLPWGDEAVASGVVEAVLEGGRWTGSARARLERIDLAVATAPWPHRVSGEAVLEIDRINWNRGRIEACECRCAVSRGRVGQRLLDALVTVLGCRPGPAYRSLTRDEIRGFDDVSCGLRIDSTGMRLTASPGRGGTLVRVQGLSVVDEPVAGMPLDRLAWLMSPPGAASVPASRATAWLLERFPLDEPAASKTSAGATSIGGGDSAESRGGASSQAGRPLQRSEF